MFSSIQYGSAERCLDGRGEALRSNCSRISAGGSGSCTRHTTIGTAARVALGDPAELVAVEPLGERRRLAQLAHARRGPSTGRHSASRLRRRCRDAAWLPWSGRPDTRADRSSASSSAVGLRDVYASAGSRSTSAFMIRFVSASSDLPTSVTGSPTRTRTVGGFATFNTLGSRAERGHTFSVPHRSDRDDRRAGHLREAGRTPSARRLA